MKAQIAKWGNSLAVRLPRRLAEEARMAEGTKVELEVEGRTVVVRPAAPSYRLTDLLKGITRDNLPDEITDDGRRGAELL